GFPRPQIQPALDLLFVVAVAREALRLQERLDLRDEKLFRFRPGGSAALSPGRQDCQQADQGGEGRAKAFHRRRRILTGKGMIFKPIASWMERLPGGTGSTCLVRRPKRAGPPRR